MNDTASPQLDNQSRGEEGCAAAQVAGSENYSTSVRVSFTSHNKYVMHTQKGSCKLPMLREVAEQLEAN